MTEYYVPKAGSVKLPSGRTFKFHRGIQAVPDELANHASANDLGIKPTSEMTDAEWKALGLKPPVAAAVPGSSPKADPAATSAANKSV